MLLRCRPFNNIHTQTALVRYLYWHNATLNRRQNALYVTLPGKCRLDIIAILQMTRSLNSLWPWGYHGGTLSVREQDTDRSTKRLGYQAEEVGEYGSKSRCYILSLGLIKNWGCFNCNTYISFIDRIQSSVNVDFSWMVAVGHF